MDDDPFNVSNISVAGGFTLTNSTIEFTGCVEEYPVVHNYPYIECRDQNTGGYGDGLGTASTSGDWVFDHDVWFANFQDGLDLLHSGMRSLSVTNSQSIANDGQAYKIGSGDNIIFRNNVAVVNCARIMHLFGDEPASAIVPGVSPCRAAGDGILFSFTDQGSYTVQNNSFTGYNGTMFDLACESGWDYCQNAATVFQNNLVLGYSNTIDGSGQTPGLFYMENASMPANAAWAVRDHNFYYNIRYCAVPLQTGETCDATSPQLTAQPVSPVTSSLSLDNFNFMPTAGSPLNGVGLSLPAVATDINGLLRPSPPSIGAEEYSATGPLKTAEITLTTPSTSTSGQSVTLTATIATISGVVPTGTITFSAGGTVVGTGTVNSAGVATLATSSLTAGLYTVTGSYSGDSNYAAGGSDTALLTVSAAAQVTPQVTLGLSPSIISLAQSTTLTVAVSTQSGIVPTGTISFSVAGIAVGSATLNSSGIATFVTTPLAATIYSVTATYSGDSTYASGSSNAASLTVNAVAKKTPVVTLGLSPSIITQSQSVGLTVAVSTQGGIVPTGTISFSVGGVTVGSATLNSSGIASYSTTPSASGALAVVATYSGDSNYGAGNSNTASLTVNPGTKKTPVVTLGLSPSIITLTQPATLTVAVSTQGGVVPTGTISFSVAGVTVGSASLNGSGIATYSTTPNTTGSLAVTASYSGDSNYAAGGSNSTSLTVNPATKVIPTVTLGLSPSTITLAQSSSLTVAVSTQSGVVPTGTVSFIVAGVTVGSAALNGSGVATYVTTPSAAGSLSVVASYSGDSNYAAGGSNTASLTVNPGAKAVSTVTLGLSPSTINLSQSATATVAVSTQNGVVPTGTVSFSVAGVTVGSAALNGSGVATYVTTPSAAGSLAVTASYSGDPNYSAGGSNTASLTVNQTASSVSVAVAQPEFGFNVIPGSKRRIFATVTNGSTNQVVWTVKSGTATLSSTAGSWIDVIAPTTGSSCSMPLSNGAYSVTSATQFTVEATSVDDATQRADVTFNVCNPAVQVSVVPFYRTLYAKQSADVQSLVVGSVAQNVHWAITSSPNGGDGKLVDTTSRDTVFSATIPGQYQLTATSQADPTKSATAIMYVTGHTIPYASPVTPNQTEPVDCSVDPTLQGSVYDVGPSQAYTTLASVPFPTMAAGSTVRLHNEDMSRITSDRVSRVRADIAGRNSGATDPRVRRSGLGRQCADRRRSRMRRGAAIRAARSADSDC